MSTQSQRSYIYLDTDEERKKLVTEISSVRAAALRVIDAVPETEWYTPRYHGWSLGAMLGHLNTVDNMALFQIQAALLHIRPPVPLGLINWMNSWMSRIYQNRVVRISKTNIQKNEKRIVDFIMHLPMNRFSHQIYYPPFEQYTTVEKILQDYFVHHWHEHLQTMCAVEGLQQPSIRWNKD